MLYRPKNLDQQLINMLSAVNDFQQAAPATVKQFCPTLEVIRDHLSNLLDRAEGKK